MISYVTGFLFSPDGTLVALIKKINPLWQRGQLNGIGGKVEPGESPRDAMSREFLEEASVKVEPECWLEFARIERAGQYKVHFFSHRSLQVFEIRSVEREEVSIFRMDALPENALPNLRWLLPLSQDKRLTFKSPVLVVEDA